MYTEDSSPTFLFAITMFSIFLAEVFIMVMFFFLPPLGILGTAFLDGTLLTMIIFPMLYFFVLRPMQRHVVQRREVEGEKEEVIKQLRKSLAEIKVLRGIVPICVSCKKVRDDEGFWQQVEVYVRDRTEAEFSHGLCSECAEKLYPEEDDKGAP
jgi:hypothetical protein